MKREGIEDLEIESPSFYHPKRPDRLMVGVGADGTMVNVLDEYAGESASIILNDDKLRQLRDHLTRILGTEQ